MLWFEHYLNDRNQKVLINENSLSQKQVSAGVPQGFVLGPLLFLIYVNDISDDLTGLARHLNPKKTEVMFISYVSNDNNFELIMDGTILKIVETHKHLGVHLSSDNKRSKHIDSIIESTSMQISYFRKIKY